jgi:hypothetical protein
MSETCEPELVRCWEEQDVIPVHPMQAADPNPMVLDKRVYQGSSGKVYPSPFTDRVALEKVDTSFLLTHMFPVLNAKQDRQARSGLMRSSASLVWRLSSSACLRRAARHFNRLRQLFEREETRGLFMFMAHRFSKHSAKRIPAKALLILLLAIGFTGVSAHGQQTTVVLDGNGAGRVFDGLGAASAGASSRLLIDYPEPQRSQILDYLFKPGYGAALQHLKVEIGADVNSTDGSEPGHMRTAKDHDATRGYEWWLMTEAHRRNPNIVLEILPWGAPRWVEPDGAGKETLYSHKMAEYVVDFIQTAKREYSLDIAYAGIWNERPFGIPYIKDLHNLIKADHLSTRIACCDGDWSIADEVLKDPELAADIDVIGAHYPRDEKGNITTTDAGSQDSQTAMVQRGPTEWRQRPFCEPGLANRRTNPGAHLQPELPARDTNLDRDLEPDHFLLRQPCRTKLRADVRQHAVERVLRRAIHNLGDGPHHAVRSTRMAISRFRIRLPCGERELCRASFE